MNHQLFVHDNTGEMILRRLGIGCGPVGVLGYSTFTPVMLSRLFHAARLASTWKEPRSHWSVMKIDRLKSPLAAGGQNFVAWPYRQNRGIDVKLAMRIMDHTRREFNFLHRMALEIVDNRGPTRGERDDMLVLGKGKRFETPAPSRGRSQTSKLGLRLSGGSSEIVV